MENKQLSGTVSGSSVSTVKADMSSIFVPKTHLSNNDSCPYSGVQNCWIDYPNYPIPNNFPLIPSQPINPWYPFEGDILPPYDTVTELFINMPSQSVQFEPLASHIAAKVFTSKKDLGGKSYYDHLKRVAENFNNDHTKKTIAWLHDILEDCPDWSCAVLKNLFTDHIADSVQLLTKKPKEKYVDYIKRIADSKNSDAIAVKLADLKDNMDLTRLDKITDADLQRTKKYHSAYKVLSNVK